MPTNPLDIPEILARVGQFLPLWVPQRDSRHGTTTPIRFEPQTLLNCSLVSKLWHQTLTPILWYAYFSFHMGDNAHPTDPHNAINRNNVVINVGGSLPPEIVSRNSIHFRVFEAAGNSSGPFYCTRLIKVSFLKEFYGKTKMGIENQRALVRANPRVRELYWCGANDPYERLVGEDFGQLKGLRILRLSHWSGGGGCLKDVLRSVAGSLQLLELGAVVDVQIGDIAAVDARSRDPTTGGTGNRDPHRRLVLPLVENLSLTQSSRNPGIVELVECCPNLKHLLYSFSSVGHIDNIIARFSNSLRNHCPDLNSLTLVSSFYDDVTLTSRVLREGPVPGQLEKLEVSVAVLDNELVGEILRHAEGLTDLRVVSYGLTDEDIGDDDDDMDGGDGGGSIVLLDPKEELDLVLRILVECRNLRRFKLTARAFRTLKVLCDTLGSQPWGCVGLEHLAVDTGYSFLENNKSIADVGGGEAEPFISSEVAFLGWLLLPQGHESLNRDAERIEKETLRMVFGLVKGLRGLKTMTWNHIVYTRCQ
ncbi:hypothetical protein F5H01DRAFT_329423 [Linnemannia elongata]|nr:hypothetical protein F5H01DRAFT_329423 [Linnemannia elongata]